MTASPKRRWIWLAIAAALFAAGAGLMSLAQPPARTEARRVRFPRGMDSQAEKRLERRRTLPRLKTAALPDEPGARPTPTELGDPIIAAMPARIERAAIVIEANALRHSPVGRLVVDCLLKEAGGRLAEANQKLGFDLLEDLDRATFIDDTFLFSGFFQDANWPQILEGATSQSVDPRTTLWQKAGEPAVAVWNQQMVVVGKTEAEVMAIVDRLEGRTPRADPPVLAEQDSYGEVYGVVAPATLASLLRQSQPHIAERLASTVERVKVHMDASSDVGIVAEAEGLSAQAGDLGRMIGGALTVSELAARARQDDQVLAQLLEHARVVPAEDGKSFRTEIGLPYAFFEEWLRGCRFLRGELEQK